jgi:phosphate/sulfate permease
MIKNIALAWVITLPVSAIISSIAFLSLMQLNG